MDFLTFAKDRYSCRALSDRPVEPEKLERILAAALAAPTACNNQPFRIWVLQSPEALEKAAHATRFTFGAPVILAVGGLPSEAWVRPFDGRNFAGVDAAIVATHLMLAIHAEGLGTTWIGYFDADRLKTDFPEMAPYDMIALFPIGYPAPDAAPAKGHFACRPESQLIGRL